MNTKVATQSQIAKLKTLAERVEGTLREYSGRFMYGKQCWGITCSNVNQCLEEAGALGLRGAKCDNMGLKYIVYWPSLGYEAPKENL